MSFETRRFFGKEAALFLGPLPPAAVHSHHAIQGCVAVSGQLEVAVESQPTTTTVGALIAPDVPHAVSASGLVAHFYALPESPVGARLVAALSGRSLIELEASLLAEARCLVRESLIDERRMPQCLETLLARVLRHAPPAPPRDARVRAALDTLRFRSADTPLEDLAREAGLSPDRLRHLIREEAGIPLRKYRKWTRLLRAVEALRDTGSVTAAACTSGFADAAHLSRAFRDTFTFPPSEFVRDSRFVQANRGGSR